MTPYQQIIVLRAKLSAEEKRKLAIVFNTSTFSGKSSIAKSKSISSDWLFDGIIYELGRRGMKYQVRTMEKVLNLAPHYEDDSEFVRQTLKGYMGRHRVQRYQLETLGAIAARTLINSFRFGPISLKRALVNVDKTLETMDDSFPDYMRYGMLSMVVQIETTKNKRLHANR